MRDKRSLSSTAQCCNSVVAAVLGSKATLLLLGFIQALRCSAVSAQKTTSCGPLIGTKSLFGKVTGLKYIEKPSPLPLPFIFQLHLCCLDSRIHPLRGWATAQYPQNTRVPRKHLTTSRCRMMRTNEGANQGKLAWNKQKRNRIYIFTEPM